MTQHQQHHEHHHHADHRPALAGAPRSLTLLLCLGALAGVLIWAKLRLVTDIPRSAYADPKDRQVIDDAEDPIESAEDRDHLQTGTDTPESGGTPDSPARRP